MADRSVRVMLSANVAGFESGLRSATTALKAFQVEGERVRAPFAALEAQLRQVGVATAATVEESRGFSVAVASTAELTAATEASARASRSAAVAQGENAAAARTAAADTAAAARASASAYAESAAATVAAQEKTKKTLGTVSTGVLAIAGVSVYAAVEFQKKLTLLQTAAGELPKNLAMVGRGIIDISNSTGVSASKVANGMFIIEKAGFKGADGLNVLKAAMQGATAEGADTATMGNALTSVMASFHMPASKAATAMSEVDRAAGLSKTTMQDFAGSLSTVLPVASNAGLSFAEVGGAIATLTSHGTSAAEATQELAATIKNLQAPNNVAKKEMNQLGIDVQDLQANLGKRGLAGTLDLVIESLGKTGPGGQILLDSFKKSKSAGQALTDMLGAMPPQVRAFAQQLVDGSLTVKQFTSEAGKLTPVQADMARQFKTLYLASHGFNDILRSGNPNVQNATEALKKMMGGSIGLNTILMLTGGSAAGFADATKQIGAQAGTAAGDIATFAETQGTAASQLNRTKAQLENVGIALGTMLLPVLVTVASNFSKLVGWLQENWTWVGKVAGVMVGLAVAVKAVMIVEKVVTAFGLMKTALLGVGGIVSKASAGFTSLASGFRTAGTGADEAAGKFSGVGKAIAGGGLLAIGLVAYKSISDSLAAVKASQADVTNSTQTLTTALVANGGAWNAEIKAQQIAALAGDDNFKKLVAGGVNYADLMDLLTGKTKDNRKVQVEYFKAVQSGTLSLTDGNETLLPWITNMQHSGEAAAAAAKQQVAYNAAQSGGVAATLVAAKGFAAFGQAIPASALRALHGDLDAAGSSASKAVDPTKALASEMKNLGGDLKTMKDEARNADLKTMNDALKTSKDRAGLATTELEFFTLAIDKLIGRNVSAEEATKLLNDQTRAIGTAFKDAAKATHDNTASLIDNKGHIDTTTEAGSKLYDSVSAFQKAYDTATTSAVSNAGANATVKQKVDLASSAADVARASFIHQAEAAGLSKTEADKLADSMSILEGKRLTPKILGLSAQDEASAVIAGVQRRLDAFKNKTVTLEVLSGYTPFGSTPASALRALHNAAGGTIDGPGPRGVDSVLTYLAPGEEVIRTAQADKHRPLLKAINAGVHGYASGGTVGVVDNVSHALNDFGGKPTNLTVHLHMGDTSKLLSGIGQLIPNAMKAAKQTIDATQARLAAQMAPGSPSGLLGSQDPSAWGWMVGQNIVPYSFNGIDFPSGVASGTESIWSAFLTRLVPLIPGGLRPGEDWGYENRANVNNPSQKSFHAYGLALDVNSSENPNMPGTTGPAGSGMYQVPASADSLARQYNMLWGGEWGDAMHFELHQRPGGFAAAQASSGASGAYTGGAGASTGSGVQQWADLAATALAMTGQYSATHLAEMLHQMDTESSGNPQAINLWDQNARNGIPSKGLMQVIDPTFRTYAMPGFTGNIYDPLSNMLASIRYVLATYNSLDAGYRGVAYAGGGAVHGPGPKGKDSLLSWLAPGEHVLTDKEVAKMGGHQAVYAFRQGLMGNLPHLAFGGSALPALPSARSLAGIPDPTMGQYMQQVVSALQNITTVVASSWDRYTAALQALPQLQQNVADRVAAQQQTAAGQRVNRSAAAQRVVAAESHLDAVQFTTAVLGARRVQHAEERVQVEQDSLASARTARQYEAAARRVRVAQEKLAEAQSAISTTQVDSATSRLAAALIHEQKVALSAANANAHAARATAAAQAHYAAAQRVTAGLYNQTVALQDLNRAQQHMYQQQQAIVAQWDLLAPKLAAAQTNLAALQSSRSSLISSVSGTVAGYGGGITGYSAQRGTYDSIMRGQMFDIAKAEKFALELKRLQQLGLSATTLSTIAQAGVDGGGVTAAALSLASKAQIARLNATQKQLGDIGNYAGGVVGGAMYNAGVNAALGLEKGLLAQELRLSNAAKRLANAILAPLRAALRIHSPSEVMHELGSYTAQGFINGLTSRFGHVQAAMSGMVRAPSAPYIPQQITGAPVVNLGGIRVFVGDREISNIVRVEVGRSDPQMIARMNRIGERALGVRV